MNRIEYSIEDMKKFMATMGTIYDAVRLVNASECCEMSLDSNGTISYGSPCYAAWNRSRRCRDCSSYRAYVTGLKQEKQVAMPGRVYTVISVPATLLMADGTPYACIMEMISVDKKDEDVAAKIRERAREGESRAAQAEEERDLLTGLYGAEEFYRKARLLLRAHPGRPYLMVYADIDDFKLVNDIFGRIRGNEILLKTSQLLISLCRGDDLCARLNADNFILCVEEGHVSDEALADVVRRVNRFVGHSAFSLQLRFGIYAVTDPALSIAVMCDRAKIALHTIKEDSQRFVAHYTSALLQQKLYEQKIISEFDTTLTERQYRIYLQPQISAADGLTGAEVLVRWHHPRRGVVAPGDFIGVLEKTGLISRLDRYVWEEAVALLKKWQGTDRDRLYLSINISGKDFYYLDVYQTITGLVEKYGVPPGKLRLEITETVLMADVDKLLQITRSLREYGFMIEIDDFGKGYSSLSMLKDIDVDVLKIDMEFLRKTEREERSRVILGSVISMTKGLGMGVITEGVETERQVRHLQKLGCDDFQGFYFARPMPVEEFERRYFGGNGQAS